MCYLHCSVSTLGFLPHQYELIDFSFFANLRRKMQTLPDDVERADVYLVIETCLRLNRRTL